MGFDELFINKEYRVAVDELRDKARDLDSDFGGLLVYANHEALMIRLEDCIAFSGLTEAQVLAIAEHEHLPEIAATALAQYLSKQERGMEKIRDMIVDDIRQAQQRQDKAHVVTLLHVLHHFLKLHPEVRPSQHPWSKLY
jgi:Rad3-related DNA helicase